MATKVTAVDLDPLGLAAPPSSSATPTRPPKTRPKTPGRRGKGPPGRPYRKYRNRKCVVYPNGEVHELTDSSPAGGLVFDSLKEARRWCLLLAEQKAGKIVLLRRQVRFRLDVNGVLVCRYVADFTYRVAGKVVVEDCKSPITKTLPEYRIKRALMLACHGIEVLES